MNIYLVIIVYTAIGIGFEQSSYNFMESLSTDSVQVFLAKIDGRTSEQTFQVIVQVSDSGFIPPDPNTQLATLSDDFNVVDAVFQDVSTVSLEFPSSYQRINFTFHLVQDNIPEGTEVFRASLAPVNSAIGPNGELVYIPRLTNLFSETLIYIEDDDSKFLFHVDIYVQ